MKQSTIKVVIACKEQLTGHALSALLQHNPEYDVCLITNSVRSLKAYLKDHIADLLITDIILKDSDTYGLIKQLNKRAPHLNIMILTDRLHFYTVSYAMKYGVKGLISSDTTATEFYKAIDKVVKGKYHYNKLVRKQLVEDIRTEQINVYEFNRKERQFLRLIVKDLSYEQIAKRMKIPFKTMEKYRERMFKEFSIKNRSGLILFALRTGLADI